jgi:hypothetical protein
MTQSEYTTRVIAPEDGKFLTQADNNIALSERVVTDSKVYLAITDSPENWREISAEEAQEILKAQEELAAKAAEGEPLTDEPS